MLPEFFNKRPVLPLLECNLSRTRQVFLKNFNLTQGKISVVIVHISLVIQAEGMGGEIRRAHCCSEAIYDLSYSHGLKSEDREGKLLAVLLHMMLNSSLLFGCPHFTFNDDLDTAVVGAPLS